MRRRKALKLTVGLLGGSIIGSDLFLAGCVAKNTNTALFSDSDVALLDEVGETILPTTERSPGAKAANIGLFMTTIVTDCYDEKEQHIFMEGLLTLNQKALDKYSKNFVELAAEQRQLLLVVLDSESTAHENTESPHFFNMIKQLTIWGYFTSEPGVTKALRYIPIPGEFKGCVPYAKGDKAWA